MNTVSFLLDRDLACESLPPETRLLDVIRQEHRLTGCKAACGEGDCGACMVLIGRLHQGRLRYQPAMACLLGLGAVEGCHVVTIHGLSDNRLNPIQQALVDRGAIQCGFCTPGLVVALTAFFLSARDANLEAAFEAMAGNLCRCTGYSAIKRAIAELCARFDLSQSALDDRIHDAIAWGWLPPYFATIAERLQSLAQTLAPSSDIDALWVGGGSDLWAHPTAALSTHPLYFLPMVEDDACVSQQGDSLTLAGETTIEQLRQAPLLKTCWPSVSEDLAWVASSPIRQHATLAGNLVNASPIGDLAVCCLALDAELCLDKHGHTRRIDLRDFYLGYKHTALEVGECLRSVSFQVSPSLSFSFEKVGKRPHLDIASVNSALSLRLNQDLIEEAHVSAGGVAPVPLYLRATSEALQGQRVSAELVCEAAAIAQTEIAPLSDLRGSDAYKRLLLRQLIQAHFLKLCPRYIRWEALYELI